MGGTVSHDTTSQVLFSADPETWTINKYVLVYQTVGSAVVSLVGHSTLINNGIVYSAVDGVQFGAGSSVAVIKNNASGVIKGATDGIFLDGNGATVTNSGGLVGGANGIHFSVDSKHVALTNNSGADIIGIRGVFAASDYDGSVINNSGLIHGSSYGIGVFTKAGLTTVIHNFKGGQIEGSTAAIRTDLGALALDNGGTIKGIITCVANAGDKITNTGKITGDVHLGPGNDSFTSAGGTSGKVFGEDGNDTFVSGPKIDRSDGGNQNDTFKIAGALGVGDSFNGGAGTDRILVTGGTSTTLASFSAAVAQIETWQGNGKGLFGTAAANVFNFAGLTTKSGLPFVDGGAGSDTLIGSKFADVLRGGLGKDTLTGGLGLDHFDFNGLAESVKGSNRDVITDFNRTTNHDKIDLSGIDAKTHVGGNQQFAFIGSHAFTHHDGELRFSAHVLQGDVNGDAHADFEVHVNLATLVKGDFFL